MSQESWQIPEQQQPAPQVPQAIAHRLGALRRRIRRYLWIQGFALLAVTAVVGFWLALALDYLPTRAGFPEMPRTARAIQLAVVAAVLLWVAWRALVRPQLVRLPGTSLALLLERFSPAFQHTLVTTVQLAEQQRPVSSTTYVLWKEAARRAQERLAALSTRELLNRRRLAMWTAAAGVALATVLALAIVRGDMFQLAVRRLVGLSNQPWPRHAYLEVLGFTDRQRKIAIGGDLVIRVRADADRRTPPPETCQIRYETDQGGRGRVTMSRDGQPRDGYQYYIFRGKPFQAIRRPIDFYVVGRDYRTDPYRVVAVEPPRLERLDIVYVPPTYTGLLRRQQRYHPGVAVPSRSEVTLVGRATKGLRQLELAGDFTSAEDSTGLWTIAQDPHRFSIPLGALDQDRQFDLTLVDSDGIRSGQAYSIRLQSLADQVPAVDLRLSGIGSAVTPDARLPFDGKIEDDYGVARAWFEVQRQEQRREFALSMTSTGQLDQPLDLRELRANPEPFTVEPGQVIQITVCAEDQCDVGGDRVGRNQTVQLDVVRPDQLLAMLEARELGLRQRLEQIVGELTEDRDSLVRLREDLKPQLEPTALKVGSFIQVDSPDEKPAAEEPAAEEALDEEATDEVPTDDELNAEEPAGDGQGETLEAQDPLEDDPAGETEQQEAADRQSLHEMRVQRALQDAQRVEHEVLGLAAAFADIQDELDNNRINSSARQERLQQAIIEPLQAVAGQEIPELQSVLEELNQALRASVGAYPQAERAVFQCDAVLARLQGILDSMLEMESYKDLLDLLRSIVQQQEELLEQTKEQQKEELLEGLFSE